MADASSTGSLTLDGTGSLEEVQLRVHGPSSSAITLVYLPGVHGDWTLIGGFRRALGDRVRFVEMAYPRTTSWSLEDYAKGVEEALREKGISRGWLLGESFGSQVAWAMLEQNCFKAEGLILAGGFARHPAPWMARLAAALCGTASFAMLRMFFRAYARVCRFRFRRSPEIIATMHEFLDRRTEADCRAAKHRLALVAANDPRQSVRRVTYPVYALAGFFDPIVPWFAAQRWLRRHCPGCCGRRLVWRADHNVLGTAPDAAAMQILEWMTKLPKPGRTRGICPPR